MVRKTEIHGTGEAPYGANRLHMELSRIFLLHMELSPIFLLHMELKAHFLFHKFKSLPYRLSCLTSMKNMEVNSSSMISRGTGRSVIILGISIKILVPWCIYGS